MISALFYLQYWSIRNRLMTRFQRLRQPKYLAGAVVGGLYFYWYLFRQFSYGGGRSGFMSSQENVVLYEGIGALILAVVMLLAWVFPYERAALTFSEAEIAFLFPAPVTRRGLIHFKLLRSEMAILFTSMFFTLISRRFGGGNVWIHGAGWFLILSILNLHLLGSSLARTILMDRGITNWTRRVIILFFVFAFAALVVVWAQKTLPSANVSDLDSLSKIEAYARQVLSSGPLPYLLAPFRWIVCPYFAPDARTFFILVWPALGLMALHYVWVTASDVAFEEASLDASKKLAERTAAIRSGNWRAARKKMKAMRAPFSLGSTGFPPIALLWKNLISAGQVFTARLWIWLAAIAVGAAFAFQRGSAESPVLASMGLIALMFLVYSVVLGPQIVRHDFRQDLLMADTLRMFPLPGWQIALGELLSPAAILTGAQWCLLIVLVGFIPKEWHGFGLPRLLAASCGAAINLPVLNLISLLIPNAAVLLFPAWFHLGKSGPQGIEATGQRLIFFLGQIIVFAIALIPAAGVFIGIFFAAKFFIGAVVGIALASLASMVILGCEAAAGLKLLGWLFERFDLSAELPS